MAIWLSTRNGLERSAPESLQRSPWARDWLVGMASTALTDACTFPLDTLKKNLQARPGREGGRDQRRNTLARQLARPLPLPPRPPVGLVRPLPPPTSARHRSSMALLPAGRWRLLPGAGAPPPPPRRLAAPLQRVWPAARHAGRLWGPLELGLRERAGALLEPRLDLILRVCV